MEGYIKIELRDEATVHPGTVGHHTTHHTHSRLQVDQLPQVEVGAADNDAQPHPEHATACKWCVVIGKRRPVENRQEI